MKMFDTQQILKVQKAVLYGAKLFSVEHSHGLIFVLLVGMYMMEGRRVLEGEDRSTRARNEMHFI